MPFFTWPVPKDAHEVRSLLGLCSFYCWFVKGFAQITKPLNHLMRSVRQLSIGQINASKRLKTARSYSALRFWHSQIRRSSLFWIQMRVRRPWSKKGYCLLQLETNSTRVDLLCYKKELLVVVKSIKHFHKYSYGQKFVLRTDRYTAAVKFQRPRRTSGSLDSTIPGIWLLDTASWRDLTLEC